MININLRHNTSGLRFSGKTAAVCLWAPMAKEASLLGDDGTVYALHQQGKQGYWETHTDQIGPGYRYRFCIDGRNPIPDPASLAQPEGVHGSSEAKDIRDFDWSDEQWEQIPLAEYIIYELHTGTFSASGDFNGIADRIDYLLELGITAIELMPVAQFEGSRNWGYDGVYPYAVQHSYGGATALQQLVDTCHRKGMAVILDVVYNHLGITGNYLPASAPYLTDQYKTAWGDAINFDGPWSDGVRRYFIENALMWFRDFHIDALRLDAVHAIRDFSPIHLLRELRYHTDRLEAATGRKYYLIAESDLNDSRIIDDPAVNGYGLNAQWADEFHHALRVTAGEPRAGYYSDFGGIEQLAKAYLSPYVYDGIYSAYRHKTFGNKADHHPPANFVVCSQNHDQVGNRPDGTRSTHLYSTAMQRLMAAAVLMSPYIPLLFMGEEWGSLNTFNYFVDPADKKIAEAIHEGRKKEFGNQYPGNPIPDPSLEETFLQSKLDWPLSRQEPHQTMQQFYRELILLRKQQPALRTAGSQGISVQFDTEKNTLSLRRDAQGYTIVCLMNFSGHYQNMVLPANVPEWYRLLDSAAPEWGDSSRTPDIADSTASLCVHPESLIIYSNRYV